MREKKNIEIRNENGGFYKIMKKYIITIAIIVGVILALFGSYYIYSSNNSQDNISNLKLKADEEIMYLNTTIISMMNKLNNISYANYKVIEEEVPAEDENMQSSSENGKSGQDGGGTSSKESGGAGGESSRRRK